MRILITNDDGQHAQQLVPFVRWCRKLGEVTVVVPKVEQSGKSHSIDIRNPFEAKQVELAPDVTAWAVDSTPADCVRIAVLGMQEKFDLALSGINRGLNIGADIMYSGTVAAASEAVNLGIPAVAVSTTWANYPKATERLDEILEFFRREDLLSKHTLYNVNIPTEGEGIRITRQGGPYFSDDYQKIGDCWQPNGVPVWEDSQDDTLDTDATMHGYITISPLTISRTDWEVYRQLTK